MAAPTDVSVEATSITSTKVWFTHSPGAISAYRSTDGSIFALAGTTAPGATFFIDTGLLAGTKYWYKLSDDNGSTFSSTVTVYTMACPDSPGNAVNFSLPRFDGPEQQSDQLNNLAERVEAVIGERVVSPGSCEACVADGALVIDCGTGCKNWVVAADQDINSISVNNCETGPTTIEFIVPPNVTRRICGFPPGLGFTGDECRKTPLVTGTNGGSFFIGTTGGGGTVTGGGSSGGRNTYNPGIGGGSGSGGGADCTCVPLNGALTIKCCTADCSMSCSGGKSLTLKVCGGRGPYSWSKTGTVQLKGSTQSSPAATAEGTTITVTPPTNSGSGVAGTAYVQQWFMCSACSSGACTTVNSNGMKGFGCNDQDVSSGCQASVAGCSPTVPGAGAMTCCDDGVGCDCLPTTCEPNVSCKGVKRQCDARTAQMITDGCSPCGIAANGATVSVTDANNVTFTITLGT